jgi:hypothetical protein
MPEYESPRARYRELAQEALESRIPLRPVNNEKPSYKWRRSGIV